MLTRSYLSNLLILLFVSQLFITTGFSQSTSYLDSLDGKFALQFQINDTFSLSSFQGTIFSGKYHFSCRDAVRLGLSLELGDSDSETTSNQIDTVNIDTYKRDRGSFAVIINSQYIRYIRGTESISFYSGAGPFFSYGKSTASGEIEQGTDTAKIESASDFYSVGLDLLFGVEWWFSKYMSLSAEYGIKFMYRSNEVLDKVGVIKRELTETNFRITANSVNFGLSVYF